VPAVDLLVRARRTILPDGERPASVLVHAGRIVAVTAHDTVAEAGEGSRSPGGRQGARGLLCRRKEVVMMSVADFADDWPRSYQAVLDEEARRKGVRPIASIDELRADVWESDEELDEFLADLDRFRHEYID
jgi:hypothetical protein